MDEGLHQEFATFLYNNYVVNKLSKERILQIVNEAIEIEKEFVSDALPVRLIGINEGMMRDYIQSVGDNILNDLGIKVNVGNNPLKFMEKIAMEKKANFFEKRVSEYNKADLTNLNFNEDF